MILLGKPCLHLGGKTKSLMCSKIDLATWFSELNGFLILFASWTSVFLPVKWRYENELISKKHSSRNGILYIYIYMAMKRLPSQNGVGQGNTEIGR